MSTDHQSAAYRFSWPARSTMKPNIRAAFASASSGPIARFHARINKSSRCWRFALRAIPNPPTRCKIISADA
eukprot:1429602-Lingulodinium_polyedra.AAC.1